MRIVTSRVIAALTLLTALAGGCVGFEGSERPRRSERRFEPRVAYLAFQLEAPQATALLLAKLAPGESLHEVVVWNLPLTGTSLAVGVLRTSTNARLLAVNQLGDEVDFGAAKRAEQTTRLATFGKMSEPLFETQSYVEDDTIVDFEVVIYSEIDPSEPPYDGTDVRVSEEDFRAHVTREQARIRAQLDEAKQPLTEWLRNQGATVVDRRGLPVLSVRGSASLLRDERLHAEDVSALDTVTEASRTLGYGAHASMREDSLTGGLCGGLCYGGGVAVGIWEFDTFDQPGPLAIATGNARLSGGSVTFQFAPMTCTVHADCNVGSLVDNKCVGGTCQGLHVSTVASLLG